MWYRTAKKLMKRQSGYSTELGYLKDTLTTGIDPYDYLNFYHQYLEETDPELAEQMDPHEASEAVYDLNQQGLDAFKSWLGNQNIQGGNYEDPIYHTINWQGYSRPDWNIHFTNEADSIAQNGFQYGHPDTDGLHLTTHKRDENRKKEPGYNFSFPADARDAHKAERDGKYGNEGVVFFGGGADTYHHGDEEKQRLFWGKNVDPRMIFPIKRDGDSWYVEDATGRTLVEGKNYGNVVNWIKKNYRMLQSIKEKEVRRSLERQHHYQKQRAAGKRSAQYEDANLGAMDVNQRDMDHVMNQFIKGGQGIPQFIQSSGKTHLLIHGTPPQDGIVQFYIGPNEQFGDNPVGYVRQDQLDDWMVSKGYPAQTAVIGCYSGQAQGVNSEFGNQGEINLQMPKDGSGGQLYFGD